MWQKEALPSLFNLLSIHRKTHLGLTPVSMHHKCRLHRKDRAALLGKGQWLLPDATLGAQRAAWEVQSKKIVKGYFGSCLCASEMIRADLSLANKSGLTIISKPILQSHLSHHDACRDESLACAQWWLFCCPKARHVFFCYTAYVASRAAKVKVAFLKPFAFTMKNGVYPLQKLGLYFLSSFQTVSGIAIDCTTDCLLYFSQSQKLTDVTLE